MRNDALTATVTVLCGLALVGTLLWYFITVFFNDINKEIDLKGNITEVVEFDGLALKPGGSTDYTVKLNCKEDGKYVILLSFVETSEGTLDEFVDVTVTCEGAEIVKARLSDLIEGKRIPSFTRQLSKGTSLTLSVTYDMPLETGNEAQGAKCDFEMYIISQTTKAEEPW